MQKKNILGCLLAVGLLISSQIQARSAIVKSLGDLKKGEVAIVGRIELDPARGKDEPNITTQGTIVPGGIRHMLTEVDLFLGPNPGPKEGQPLKKTFDNIIKTYFGEVFYGRINPGLNYMQTLIYTISYGSSVSHFTSTGAKGMRGNWQKAFMQLNAQVTINPDDQVVYVGTLIFKRDEFNNFKGFRVVDNSATDFPLIKQQLGANAKIRKALPVVK
jgi:hypothetical protein